MASLLGKARCAVRGVSILTWRTRLRWGSPFIVASREGAKLSHHEVVSIAKDGKVFAKCHIVRKGEYHELVEVRPVIEGQPVDKALEQFRRKRWKGCVRWSLLMFLYRFSWWLIDRRL